MMPQALSNQWPCADSEKPGAADPEKAKKLLSEAGYDGRKPRIITSRDSGRAYQASTVLSNTWVPVLFFVQLRIAAEQQAEVGDGLVRAVQQAQLHQLVRVQHPRPSAPRPPRRRGGQREVQPSSHWTKSSATTGQWSFDAVVAADHLDVGGCGDRGDPVHHAVGEGDVVLDPVGDRGVRAGRARRGGGRRPGSSAWQDHRCRTRVAGHHGEPAMQDSRRRRSASTT